MSEIHIQKIPIICMFFKITTGKRYLTQNTKLVESTQLKNWDVSKIHKAYFLFPYFVLHQPGNHYPELCFYSFLLFFMVFFFIDFVLLQNIVYLCLFSNFYTWIPTRYILLHLANFAQNYVLRNFICFSFNALNNPISEFL